MDLILKVSDIQGITLSVFEQIPLITKKISRKFGIILNSAFFKENVLSLKKIILVKYLLNNYFRSRAASYMLI